MNTAKLPGRIVRLLFFCGYYIIFNLGLNLRDMQCIRCGGMEKLLELFE